VLQNNGKAKRIVPLGSEESRFLARQYWIVMPLLAVALMAKKK
jgi:hypothetical protein